MSRYIGGPCDGQEVIDIRPTQRTCGGQTYVRAGLDYYLAGTEPGSTGGLSALGTHAPKAWHDLQVSVNRRLPTALNRASRLRHAAQRKIGRKRRLR